MAPGPVVIAFAAPSGTGKTTLICRLLEELRERGLHVGAIKSDAHRVQLDTPGKDTHRMRESGARTTALVSRDQIAVFRDAPAPEIRLAEIIALFFSELDVVLAEGFREHGFPTVLVRRSEVTDDDWRRPDHVVAIASDAPTDAPDSFGLDDVTALADHLCAHHLGDARKRAAGRSS